MVKQPYVMPLSSGGDTSPEAIAEKMEGTTPLAVDLNSTSDKVNVHFDLTGTTAGKVPTVNAAGTGVNWENTTFYAEFGSTTYADIETAYNAGKAVFCINDDGMLYPLTELNTSAALFENTFDFNNVLTQITLTATSGGGWSTGTTTIYTQAQADNAISTAIGNVRQMPSVTSADNGKFAVVVNGAWTAQTVPDWNGSIT